jgi:hypothetical protein
VVEVLALLQGLEPLVAQIQEAAVVVLLRLVHSAGMVVLAS